MPGLLRIAFALEESWLHGRLVLSWDYRGWIGDTFSESSEMMLSVKVDSYDHWIIEDDRPASMVIWYVRGRGSTYPCQNSNSGNPGIRPTTYQLSHPPEMVVGTIRLYSSDSVPPMRWEGLQLLRRRNNFTDERRVQDVAASGNASGRNIGWLPKCWHLDTVS